MGTFMASVMRKDRLWLIILVISAILLSACGSQTALPTLPTQAANTPATGASNTPAAQATPLPATDTPTPTDVPATATATIEPTATLSPTPEFTATLAAGATRVWDKDNSVQIFIPAGEFIMGSTDPEAKQEVEGGRAYPEIPQHKVFVESFWIDKYEVTNGQWSKCVEEGACKPPYRADSETRGHYYDNPEYANYPVIWINWHMAKDYCEWAGKRLISEAEWEKAARGTDGRKYPWGNDPVSGELANFCDTNCGRTTANHKYNDGWADTAPVGSFPKGVSPYGVEDMAGNVWEWMSSVIRPYPYSATDGREDPEAGGERAWRSGPWSNGYWWLRTTVRYRSISAYWNVNLGARCGSTQ